MRLRKVPPRQIVGPKISATKAGLEVGLEAMEAHFLAGGDVNAVILALISSDKANIELTFERAASIDLAGRDVLDAVKVSVNPKVINTPLIAAIAKDGIQVKATCRVTVRANIDRLVGGAGEETIIARVGEGIVTTIGSAGTHKEVLENPDLISRRVLEKGLDSETAFEILSIDIADVDGKDNPRIEQALKAKQRIIAQVTKNPIAHKGARLTQEISLPGRYVVLVPNSATHGISKRLSDAERRRLRSVLDAAKPAQHGIIVRTAAEGVTEEEIGLDIGRLVNQCDEIESLSLIHI